MAEAAAPGQPLHATTVARRQGGIWLGVLLTGPSGSGKSDLALRLLAEGWRLVADDYTQVWASGGVLWAGAPPAIAGLIEARGIGIVAAPAPTRLLTRLGLAVECRHQVPERMPEPAWRTIRGVNLAQVTLDSRPASATALVRLAIAASRVRTVPRHDGQTP